MVMKLRGSRGYVAYSGAKAIESGKTKSAVNKKLLARYKRENKVAIRKVA